MLNGRKKNKQPQQQNKNKELLFYVPVYEIVKVILIFYFFRKLFNLRLV